jgi:hypothetical protein
VYRPHQSAAATTGELDLFSCRYPPQWTSVLQFRGDSVSLKTRDGVLLGVALTRQIRRGHLSSLRVCRFDGLDLGASLAPFAIAVASGCPALSEISITHGRTLADDGVLQLAQSLRTLPNLTWLDLTGSAMNDHGYRALFEHACGHITLVRLMLDAPPATLSPDSTLAFAQLLQTNHALESVGAPVAAFMAASDPALRYLVLDASHICAGFRDDLTLLPYAVRRAFRRYLGLSVESPWAGSSSMLLPVELFEPRSRWRGIGAGQTSQVYMCRYRDQDMCVKVLRPLAAGALSQCRELALMHDVCQGYDGQHQPDAFNQLQQHVACVQGVAINATASGISELWLAIPFMRNGSLVRLLGGAGLGWAGWLWAVGSGQRVEGHTS